jgi:hypothetical protein
MTCKRAEQPLSCSALEDTGSPTPENICLLAYSPQSPGTRGGSGATPTECREIKKLVEQFHEKMQQRQDGAPSRQREGK